MKITSKKLLEQRLVSAEVALAHARQRSATAKVAMINEQAYIDKLQDQLDQLKDPPSNQSDVD